MKKIVSLLSIIFCFSCYALPSYAENNIFTVDEAVAYAIENNYNLKALQTDIKKAEYTVSQEKINKRQSNNVTYGDYEIAGRPMEGFSYTVSTGFSAILCRDGYLLNTAEMQLRVAERSYESAKYELINTVNQSFYAYIGNVAKTENAKRSLETAREQKAQADLKYAQGQITKIDLTTFEMNVQKAENTLNAQERATALSMDALKNTMSYPAEDELKVTGKLELCEQDTTLPEDAIKKAQSHVTIQNLTDIYNNAQEKYKYAVRWYSSSQIEYYIEKATMERAENDYIKNKNAVELQIKSLYNDMVSSYETLDYLENNLEYVKNLADIAKIQYEMGQITATDYVSYTNNVYEVESSLEDAKLGTWTAVRNYRATYTYQD